MLSPLKWTLFQSFLVSERQVSWKPGNKQLLIPTNPPLIPEPLQSGDRPLTRRLAHEITTYVSIKVEQTLASRCNLTVAAIADGRCLDYQVQHRRVSWHSLDTQSIRLQQMWDTSFKAQAGNIEPGRFNTVIIFRKILTLNSPNHHPQHIDNIIEGRCCI